ncbi:MAG: GNAT family N-acetyltransferase [Thermoleophilia bacterium]
MGTPPPGPAVTVTGASCRLRPSPAALAVRLDGLRASDGAALDALIAKLPEPPWDAEVAVDDPVVGLLTARGFTPLWRGVLLARSVEGVPSPTAAGAEFVEYRNEWAPAFTPAEAEAMRDVPAFAELGSPSGYEWGGGHGAFWMARDAKGRVLGFAHAELPDGWIDWFGVVPSARRQGIGRGLVRALAMHVRAEGGTHLVCLAPEDGDAVPFLRAQGFTERGRRVTLIRR